MNSSEAKNLLQRYRLGLCTSEEKNIVEEWYDQLFRESSFEFSGEHEEFFRSKVWESIEPEIIFSTRRKKVFQIRKTYWTVAAAVLLLLGISFYIYQSNRQIIDQRSLPISVRYKNDVGPGTFGGQLLLGNQAPVDLRIDNVSLLADQEFDLKNQDGFILVGSKLRGIGNQRTITIKTKRGQNLKLQLEDGTKMWLNAGSEITLKVPFDSENRQVSMQGEVYFDVAKDREHPFVVESKESIIRVLGTRFNVNTYQEESIDQISLLEGTVHVIPTNRKTRPVTLHPGQQAYIGRQSVSLHEDKDIIEDISWTNGYFSFNNVPIEKVMLDLSRWYNFELVYNSAIPQDKFYGQLSRSATLSEVLRILEKSGLKFMIDGNTVTVL